MKVIRNNPNTELLKSLKRNEFPDDWTLFDMIDLYDKESLQYLLSKLTNNHT